MREISRVQPPTYLLAYLLLAVVLTLLFPSLKIIYSPYTYFGIPLIIFGLWLTFSVDALLKKKQTTVKPYKKPSVFITEGPFHFSRHPMYLGFISWLFGLAILSGNLMAFFAPAAMFITFEKIFIPYEEKSLGEEFGAEYKDYQQRVRRWF
jgi:protein-S-isoprenylcysteine O-methyltransferase Ste14